MWTEGQLLQSGNYRIVRRIGGGGFGLTYLATDVFLERWIVIKTPNDTFQADQDYERFVRRFQREGQTLARIKHPNVVSVIGFFEEAGMPCLVMAYVEGETLHERLRSGGPLAEDEAVRIFRKLAMALHQVHQAGIFHCDVHPGNVILQRNGEPVLIDFGSAKRLQPATVTVTTTINESFSPYEQRNSENKPKATLDVYGLAATLFFSVTGTKPLPSINRKLYGDTLAFSSDSESTLSQWLREAILKGMALEEQNRPASIQAFEKMLCVPVDQFTERVLVQMPIKKRQDYLQQKSSPGVRGKTTYEQTIEKPVSRKLSRKSSKTSRERKVVFPYISLSLFLLGNVFTGACMWLVGHSSDEAWLLVFAGLLSTILGGGTAWFWAVALAGAGAWFWAGAVAWAVALAGAGAGAVAWALALALAGAWAWAGAWAVALVGAVAGAGAGTAPLCLTHGRVAA